MKMTKELSSTNTQLICRLVDPEDQAAWNEFVDIYEATIASIAKKFGLRAADAADATQEVLVHLSQVISKWRPDGKPNSFRRWLYRVSCNKVVGFVKNCGEIRVSEIASQERIGQVDQTAAIPQSSLFNLELRRQILLAAVRQIRDSFSHKTWQAFWITYVDGVDKLDAANRLNMSIGAVYVARSRIMNRLQAKVKKMIDDDVALFASGNSVSLSTIRKASYPDPKDRSNDQ